MIEALIKMTNSVFARREPDWASAKKLCHLPASQKIEPTCVVGKIITKFGGASDLPELVKKKMVEAAGGAALLVVDADRLPYDMPSLFQPGGTKNKKILLEFKRVLHTYCNSPSIRRHVWDHSSYANFQEMSRVCYHYNFAKRDVICETSFSTFHNIGKTEIGFYPFSFIGLRTKEKVLGKFFPKKLLPQDLCNSSGLCTGILVMAHEAHHIQQAHAFSPDCLSIESEAERSMFNANTYDYFYAAELSRRIEADCDLVGAKAAHALTSNLTGVKLYAYGRVIESLRTGLHDHCSARELFNFIRQYDSSFQPILPVLSPVGLYFGSKISSSMLGKNRDTTNPRELLEAARSTKSLHARELLTTVSKIYQAAHENRLV